MKKKSCIWKSFFFINSSLENWKRMPHWQKNYDVRVACRELLLLERVTWLLSGEFVILFVDKVCKNSSNLSDKVLRLKRPDSRIASLTIFCFISKGPWINWRCLNKAVKSKKKKGKGLIFQNSFWKL